MTTRASPKSHWAWPGGWDNGTNISSGPAAMLPDVVLDDGVPAVKAILVPEPLVDALRRVTLLLRNAVIIIQDTVDDAGEGIVLSLSKG